CTLPICIRPPRRGRLPVLRGPPRRHVQAPRHPDEHRRDRGRRPGRARRARRRGPAARRRPRPGDLRRGRAGTAGGAAGHPRTPRTRQDPRRLPRPARLPADAQRQERMRPAGPAAGGDPRMSISYDDLTSRFGSPLYVYDLDKVAAAHDDLKAALPDGVTRYFSLKANPHPEIGRTLRERGARAEISSTGELDAAFAAGFDAAEILYTGPGKTPDELAVALDAGVRTFSVESLSDLRHVGDAATVRGVVADCLIRVNSAESGGTTSIRMTGTPSQFGIDSETLPALMPELSAVPGTRLAGVHLFSLSNAKDEGSLIAEFRHTAATAARLREETGMPIGLLDLGGGFAAPYLSHGERTFYAGLRAALEEVLDGHFPGWRDGTPRVAVESGRYLVGDCGELVCTVVNVKESRGRR